MTSDEAKAAVSALGELFQRYPSAILDTSMLPLPKREMRSAIKVLWVQAKNEKLRNLLEAGYIFLSNFQDGVGNKPIEPVAMPDTKDLQKLASWVTSDSGKSFAAELKAWTARHSDTVAECKLLLVEFNEWKLSSGYRIAADQGDADAQSQLGDMYIKGQVVPQNNAEALKWYQKAANQGHVRAQSQLGLMYLTGLGTPHNYAEALKWNSKAAGQGIASAQTALGDMFIKGLGVPRNYSEAAKWCRLAADQGNSTAQLLLGSLYNNGDGVPKDYVNALKWLTLAAAGSETEKAVSIRDFVAAKMTPAEIATAQNLVGEWKPS